jgi:hypothetical protein
MDMDESYTSEDVDKWVSAIETLHGQEVPGDSLGRTAEHEIGMLMSGYEFQDAPGHVLRMISQAMEIGYMRAVSDVQEGKFDDYIRLWRPI